MRGRDRARAARRTAAPRCSTPRAKAIAVARMGRRAPGRAGDGGRRGAGPDHDRLAAGAGSRRQGADRRRQPRRSRVADLSRRAAGLRAVRAGVRRVDCDDEGPTAAGAGARRSGAKFLYVLPNFQNPSGRCMGAGRRASLVAAAERSACRWSRTTRTATSGSTRRRRRRWRRAGRRARSISARSRRCSRRACAWATWSRRRALPQAAAGQAGGRPAHARLQPAHRARGDPRRLARRRTCRRSARATRRSAMRWPRALERAPARRAAAGAVPHGGMFFWLELPEGIDAGRAAAARRWRAAWRTSRARAFFAEPAARQHPAAVVRDRVARRRIDAGIAALRSVRALRPRPRDDSSHAALRPSSTSSPPCLARQSAGRGARCRRRSTRAQMQALRALDQPVARRPSCCRPTEPAADYRRAHLHARRANCRSPAIPRWAAATPGWRRAAGRKRRHDRAGVRRRAGADSPRRHAGWRSRRRRCVRSGPVERRRAGERIAAACGVNARRSRGARSGSTTAPAGCARAARRSRRQVLGAEAGLARLMGGLEARRGRRRMAGRGARDGAVRGARLRAGASASPKTR